MKTMLRVVLVAGAAVSLVAQPTTDDRRVARVILDNNVLQVLGGGLVGQTVKGAPYSGEAVTETTQVLADGNRISQKTSSKQFRDSEGRERQEETSAMGAIFITDPVLRVSYTLHPDTKTAQQGAPLLLNGLASGGATWNVATGYTVNGGGVNAVRMYSATTPPPPAPPPAPGTGARGAAGGGGIGAPGARSGGGRGIGPGTAAPPAPNPNVKEEQLGTTQMEGVVAQGTRTTTTIPAGQIGNQRPINVVYERWYSPDLQMTVMTKLNDPRTGETVYKLTNIVRVEQPRSLFEVPSDYTMTGGAGRGRGKQ